LRLPARTQLFSATLGMSCTGQTTIFSPLPSVVARTSSRPGTRDTAGSTAAVSEPTARKCEPKLLFIAPKSTGPIAYKALTAQKSVFYGLLWLISSPVLLKNGYERQGLQETSARPAQFEAQAKKKRREQGKMHRGAQLANTGESCSRFKPYTVKL
jgi:hypothetical protein